MELPKTTKDITIEWLNEVLHENGFLGDTNIVSLRHEPIGVGEGFSSDIAKLAAEYDTDSANLPVTMIAKFPSTQEWSRQAVRRARVFETEVSFYKDMASKIPIRTPEFIYGVADTENDNFILILKDYSYCRKLDQWEGMDENLAKLIIPRLADFHSRWWDAEDLYSFPWLSRTSDSFIEFLSAAFERTLQSLSTMDEFKAILPLGAWEIAQTISKQYPLLFEKERIKNLTVRHGDFRIGNIFLDDNTPSDPIIVYDWGQPAIDTVGSDLAWFLGLGFKEGLNDQLETSLLKSYWERLIENGVAGYSYDDLVMDYHKGLLRSSQRIPTLFANLDLSTVGGRDSFNQFIVNWFNLIIDNNAADALER
ncbi:hypothetical protein ACFLYN_04105 [Chloroflexota bacterium]